MLLHRTRSRTSAVHFDVGGVGVRAVQLARRGDGLKICDNLNLPIRGTQGREIDGLRLARMMEQGQFQGSRVALTVSSPQVRFHTLQLPEQLLDQSAERVRESLAWQISRESHTEPSEIEVRFWRLPPGHHQGLNTMAVQMPADSAHRWFSSFAEAQLRLTRIDVAPCALVRAASELSSPEKNESWGVLDLGHEHAELTIVIGNTPAYIRTLPITGRLMTERIGEAFEMPHAQAEQLKREHGIRSSPRARRAGDVDRSPVADVELAGVLFGLLRDQLEQLVHEIELCSAYVLRNYKDIVASRLVIAGGGARLSGLRAYLESRLDVPVLTLACEPREHEPVRTSTAPAIRFGTESALAFGGALLDLESA